MFTNKEKKQFVEEGIKEFAINPKFGDMLKWLIEELEKGYEQKRKQEWKEFWHNMDNPPRKKGKSYRLVPYIKPKKRLN